MARKTFSRNLRVEYFGQGDSPWGSRKTSCKDTMRSEGCIITSVAMIFKKYGDSVDPGILLDDMQPKDCPFDWWVAASVYNHTYEGKTSGTFKQLRDEIFDLVYDQRIPIMLRVPNHTVVAVGFQGTLSVDEDGNPNYNEITPSMILVNDPGKASNKTLQDVIDQRGDFEYYNYYTE
ncbi:hypothetical protein T458_08010 [Brevibacillus panacihumi W25]|uniref:Peptidase C39-like domain-containing protein n=1 Tax=Brevibacillus panacihumi W25 TaxID=1408254 RepID=V6MIK1_9BACL|nr:hypothetical protein [Brevibacillus panacihumi]EST55258.1 hypothetical protein T458_08010 [Brevibacillus panacihumi W25]